MSTTDPLPGVEYTIEGHYQGYRVVVELGGGLHRVPAVAERLRALGIEPVIAPPAPQKPAQRAQQAAEPWYNDAGEACCPWHKKPLRDGRYGLYCPSRAEGDQANDKGYCTFRA